MNAKVQEAVGRNAEPETLAGVFLNEYYKDKQVVYPINPFQILTDLGIPFTFRPFEKYEGVYIPSKGSNDLPIIGINLKRPITRQRYTAAHELCHHIKDTNSVVVCPIGYKSKNERYAENFAAALLMPLKELTYEVRKYEKNGYVDFDGVLEIAVKFGVSFESCIYRIAYKLNKIEGNTDSNELKKRIRKFKPSLRKRKLGYNDVLLYEGLIDAAVPNLKFKTTEYASRKFQNEYIYFDSRMEGVNISHGLASEIVTDVRQHKQDSEYCVSENEDIIQVAGLAVMYSQMFKMVGEEISVFDAASLNRYLYSCVPYPDYGGKLRTVNTLVTGAKFETTDYKNIYNELNELDNEVATMINKKSDMSASEYVEKAIKIHYRLTVIHPFSDGNGRTSRGFLNLLLIREQLPPVFFKSDMKDKYKAALAHVDKTRDFSLLYEVFFKAMLLMHSDLTNLHI